MKNVLVIKSSILAANSQSSQLSDTLINELNANATVRDLGVQPLPYYDIDAANATRGEPQTEKQQALLALSNSLVDELKTNDVLVLNSPLYNLGIPAQLKSYIDYIARAGVTFRYTENGPEGLIKGKKAVVIITSGGKYEGSPLLESLKTVFITFLGFIGITDVQFVVAGGFAMGNEAAAEAKASGLAQIAEVAKNI